MKSSMLDTDILSEFLRGNPKELLKCYAQFLRSLIFAALNKILTFDVSNL